MSGTVYLSGPITGLGYKQARYGWRREFELELREAERLSAGTEGRPVNHLTLLSPMRHEGHLAELGVLTEANLPDHPLSTHRGIRRKDLLDVERSDLIVVCVLGAKDLSRGTLHEMGWADALRKPVVLIMEPAGNIHDSFFFTDSADFRVPTIREGAAMVHSLLSEGL